MYTVNISYGTCTDAIRNQRKGVKNADGYFNDGRALSVGSEPERQKDG